MGLFRKKLTNFPHTPTENHKILLDLMMKLANNMVLFYLSIVLDIDQVDCQLVYYNVLVPCNLDTIFADKYEEENFFKKCRQLIFLNKLKCFLSINTDWTWPTLTNLM